ncbi:MAG: hypothetical protein LBK25_09725 [Treponema sp.]|nr:hypothetical protein [Treponema sp.]
MILSRANFFQIIKNFRKKLVRASEVPSGVFENRQETSKNLQEFSKNQQEPSESRQEPSKNHQEFF